MKKVIFYGFPYYLGGNLVLAEACRTFRLLGYDAELFVSVTKSTRKFSLNKFPIVYFYDWLKFLLRIYIRVFFAYFCPFDKRLEKYKHITFATNIRGIKTNHIPCINKESTIVIYPECQYGNPLKAKYVVRWLLYNYKYKEDAYSKDDIFVAYRNVFNSSVLNPNGYKYLINCFDNTLYHQYNYEVRHGRCYVLRKGKIRNDLPLKFDGPVFDDDMDLYSLVKMFNTYKYCYFYDTQTFYTSIAAVCGCIPIVVLESGKTEKDYLDENELEHYGIAFGDSLEQIKYAQETRHKLIEKLNFTQRNIEQTKMFITLLENKFGKLSKIS